MKGKVSVIVISLLLAIAGAALAYGGYYWWAILPVAVLFVLHKTLDGVEEWIKRKELRNGKESEQEHKEWG